MGAKRSSSISRVALGIEAILLCLPLTGLFLIYLRSDLYFHFDLPGTRVIDYLMSESVEIDVLICAALTCFWLLLLSFLLGGNAGLRKRSSGWWILPILTGFLSLTTAGLLAASQVVEPSPTNGLAWGVPFVVPLIHLGVERILPLVSSG
jgi:hypothetical protein